jgi:hypothetical protein
MTGYNERSTNSEEKYRVIKPQFGLSEDADKSFYTIKPHLSGVQDTKKHWTSFVSFLLSFVTLVFGMGIFSIEMLVAYIVILITNVCIIFVGYNKSSQWNWMLISSSVLVVMSLTYAKQIGSISS